MTSQTGFAGCGVCLGAITNPICPACLETEMKEWLASSGNETARLLEFISLATTKAIRYRDVGVKCVICGSRFSVCPHCFCENIYRFICREMPELKEEFITHFDFRIHFKIWAI